MRIVFVHNGPESLGVEYLSSVLRSKGHEVFLAYEPVLPGSGFSAGAEELPEPGSRERLLAGKAAGFRPDLACFSCLAESYRWSLGLARALKEKLAIPVVFGGVHPTAVPEKVLANDFVDFVIRGEAEFALLDLVAHLAAREPREKLLTVPNVCFRLDGAVRLNPPRPYIADLDALPFPDKRLFFEADGFFTGNPYLIIASRGCPYACTYCSNFMYRELYGVKARHVRRRSQDNVIEELALAKARWKPARIHFVDDVFTSSPEWLADFIWKYRSRIGLPFYCNVNPRCVTKETVALLKAGGCDLVGIGIESGSERVRREDYGRFETNDRIIAAMSLLKEAGISVQADNILGAPSETEEDLKRSLELYRKIKPDIIINFWLTYYPRTKIVEKAKERGFLSDADIALLEDGHIGRNQATGSLGKDRVRLFLKYEFMIELSCVCRSDLIFSALCRLAPLIPFKKAISLLIIWHCLKRKNFMP